MVAIVSDWDVPLSEPRRDKVTYRLAVASVAAGVLTPVLNPNTQITQFFESRWHQPWSEPRRDGVVRRQAVVRFASGPFSPSWNIPAASNQIRGWFQAWREPKWPKKGLRIHLQQYYTAPVRYLPKPNVTATIHAQGPPNTDTSEFLTWVYFEPPVAADQEGAKVSITEV